MEKVRPKLTTMDSSPFLLVLTIIAALFFAMDESVSLSHSHIEYATVTGFFLQDDPATDPATFDYVSLRYLPVALLSTPEALQCIRKTDKGTFLTIGIQKVATGFGLINQTYDTDDFFEHKDDRSQWRRFEHKLRTLNRHAGPHVDYKLLFMGRHGEGFHNVAERFYGTPMWDVCVAALNPQPALSRLKRQWNNMQSPSLLTGVVVFFLKAGR